MLTVHNVTFSYPGRPVINDFSLNVSSRTAMITGENGAGKTTLLLLIGGLLKPQSGFVSHNGQNVLDRSFRLNVGISASKVNLPGFMTVAELLRFHTVQFACNWPETWISRFRLEPFMKTKIADLSLGNYKKVSLLTALSHAPALLLLDEPTNGLDESSQRTLVDFIQHTKSQAIIASHEPSLIETLSPQRITFSA